MKRKVLVVSLISLFTLTFSPLFAQEVQADLNSALIEAAKDGNITEITRLLKAGADVNATTEDGWTALMWAAYWGRTEIVQMLKDAGAVE